MAMEAEWIAGELGKQIPLHLSRYFPMYRREDPATPQDLIKSLGKIASEHLDFVYIGNMVSGQFQDTRCPTCNKLVTQRSGYNIKLQNLDQGGKCSNCGTLIYKNFTYN